MMNLKDYTTEELKSLLVEMGFEGYRATQLLQWLYKRPVDSFYEMTNLPMDLRRKLDSSFSLYSLSIVDVVVSADGTRKYLFRTEDEELVESVLIPDRDRNTLCISTQVGCRMGCKFCLTGHQGFRRNLRPSEILDQVIIVQKQVYKLTNIVIMGMGEPLDNFENTLKALNIMTDKQAMGMSPRRITLSTVGIMPELKMLLEKGPPVVVSCSLNAPDRKKRMKIMPVEKRHPMREAVGLLKQHSRKTRKPPTFEYVLLGGFNDSADDALKLANLLKGSRCKVNLIPFNPWDGSDFERPSEDRILAFQNILRDNGILTFIRKSRGSDILAACGQLRWRHTNA